MGERLKLTIAFALLLTVSFLALNTLLFFELKKNAEESTYYKAYAHYLLYSINPNHRGDEDFILSEQIPRGFAYAFNHPRDQFKNVYVIVREGYFTENIKPGIKKILAMQFLLIFSLIALYQIVLEILWKRVEEGREFSKALVQSLTHKLGNFISVQKTNLSLLKRSYAPQALDRMQRSIEKLEKDVGLILRLSQAEVEPHRVWINLRQSLENTIDFLKDDLEGKRLLLRCREDLYLLADQRELEDVLYNLISNAVKYSVSFINIRAMLYKSRLILTIRNDFLDTTGKGMGLGLKLLEKHAKRMDGELTIRVRQKYNVHVCFRRFKV